MKKIFYIKYSLFVSFVCLSIILLCPYSTSSTKVSSSTRFASLLIHIKDNYSGDPINNATICIINTRQYYSSNKNGYSDTISLPLFDEYQHDDYYFYNLLIYKNGYNDFFYFNLKVKLNQKRADVVIPLIPIINESDIKTTIFYEPPFQKTIDELIKENKR